MRTAIAVVGAGYIGQAHIAALQASPTCRLAAIVDPQPSCIDLARRAGVPLFASLDRLLECREMRPEGVVIATPNPFHEPQSLQCLAERLPVLIEKPIAPTVLAAENLVAAAERAAVPVLVGHHRTHSPIMTAALETIKSGRLGRLVAVTGCALFFKPDHYFSQAPWRREPGAGPVLLNMIHEVHSLRMLCGDIIAVQAFSSNAVRGFAVEDTVAISLRFAGGALGTFMVSDTAASARSWEQTAQENAAYPSYGDEDCYLLAGTHGSLAVPTMRLKTYLRSEDRSWWKPFDTDVVVVQRDDPIRIQMEHFGAVIRREAEPIVSARDGLKNLRITEAILTAARTGEVVTLPGD
jgi:predicted dehydrogenase